MFLDLLSHVQGKKGKATTSSGTSRFMDIASNYRLYMLHDTDLPTLGIKGKSGDPWKKNLEIPQKNSEILFFPLSNLFSIEGSQQPHSQGLIPFQNGGQTQRKTLSYWTQAKITAWYNQGLLWANSWTQMTHRNFLES